MSVSIAHASLLQKSEKATNIKMQDTLRHAFSILTPVKYYSAQYMGNVISQFYVYRSNSVVRITDCPDMTSAVYRGWPYMTSAVYRGCKATNPTNNKDFMLKCLG